MAEGERTPTTKEALINVGEVLDRQGELLYNIRAEFHQFRDAVQGVPGVSQGALGELRSKLDLLAQQFTSLQQGLPDAIDKSVSRISDHRVRMGLRRFGGLTITGIASGIASLVTMVVHYAATGHW